MLRVCAVLLLLLLQIGIPGAELLCLCMGWLLPKLKVELYLEALRALKEFEQHAAHEAILRSLCPRCAKDWVLSKQELEIAACRSEIARLLLERSEDAFTRELLAFDRRELEQLNLTYEQMAAVPDVEFKDIWLGIVTKNRQVAEECFLQSARAYNAFYTDPIEETKEVPQEAAACTECKQAPPMVEQDIPRRLAPAFSPLNAW